MASSDDESMAESDDDRAEIEEHVRVLRDGDDASKTAAARALHVLARNNTFQPPDAKVKPGCCPGAAGSGSLWPRAGPPGAGLEIFLVRTNRAVRLSVREIVRASS